MSVKKFLVLTAAGIASLGATAAIAGGPDMMAPPAPVDYSGIYVDADAGWAQTDWAFFWAGVLNPSAGNMNGAVTLHGRSGFTYGFDWGYQFNRYFSAEMGWYHLKTVSGNEGLQGTAVVSSGSIIIRSWILYFAGKLSVPLSSNIDLFGKAGMGWRKLNYVGTAQGGGAAAVTAALTNQHYWAPFFGAGAQYWITPAWSVNVQYLHVGAYTRAQEVSQEAPNVGMVVGGVGYKFAV